VVNLLLGKGANLSSPNDGGWAPLHSASASEHLDVVKLLLSTLKLILHIRIILIAHNFSTLVCVDILIWSNYCLPNTPWDSISKICFNITPLFLAARNGHEKVAEFLLATDATCIHSTDYFGRTLMWSTKRSRNTQVIQLIRNYATKAGFPIDGIDTSVKRDPVTMNSLSH
jgi:ankyrin repeat protein